MKKIAVVVPESIYEKIKTMAKEQGETLGSVCNNIIINAVDPFAANKLNETIGLTKKVEDEVNEFLKKLEVGDRFSIVEASETFRNFYKTHSPKEALNLKKQIGRRLKRKVGVRGTVFEYVAMAKDEEDKPLKDSQSHAIIYEVINIDNIKGQ